MSTLTEQPSSTTPKLGSGTGAGVAGGVKLGGCMWPCGGATYIDPNVAAGKCGKNFAISAVAIAAPVLSISLGKLNNPMTPPASSCTFRMGFTGGGGGACSP